VRRDRLSQQFLRAQEEHRCIGHAAAAGDESHRLEERAVPKVGELVPARAPEQPPDPLKLGLGQVFDGDIDLFGRPIQLAAGPPHLHLLLGGEGETLGAQPPGRKALCVRVELDSFDHVDDDETRVVFEMLSGGDRQAWPRTLKDAFTDAIDRHAGLDTHECRGPALRLVVDAEHDDPTLGVGEADGRVGEKLERVTSIPTGSLEVEFLRFERRRGSRATDQPQGLTQIKHVTDHN
jgi:hypothetical protein